MASDTASPGGASRKPSGGEDDLPVLFRADPRSDSRTFILNRPAQLNALDQQMLELLKPTIEEWEKEPRCRMIIGTGNGRAFCAGGDVKSIVKSLMEGNPDGGIRFFKEEFELDYALASLTTPYVAILDGMTMGGGVGLSINAMFRVATENTVFAMPETKIGYSPDVGASFFLPRLDGAMGAYLGLTGESLRGREVFEAGIATHYVESADLPKLLDRLNGLEDPSAERIDETIEAFTSTAVEGEWSTAATRRMAVDKSFSGKTVEGILDALEQEASQGTTGESEWARKTAETLQERSPTSLRVAHELLRRGGRKGSTLEESLTLELGIATAYCRGASPDFVTGVKALLIDKVKGRPEWAPNKLADTPLGPVLSKFFEMGQSALPEAAFVNTRARKARDPMRYCLPSEEAIGQLVRGEHASSSATAFGSVDELVERAMSVWKGKKGVEGKVRDVIKRRCEMVPAEGVQEAYLRWIH